MNRILSIKRLCKDLIRFEISTKVPYHVFGTCQYVLVKTASEEPGLTLPVIKADPDRETVRVIASGNEISQGLLSMETGSTFYAVEGPYSIPVSMDSWGSVLCIADENGIPLLLPLMASIRKNGNKVIAAVLSSMYDEMLLKQETDTLTDELFIIKSGENNTPQETQAQAVARLLRTHSIGQVIVTGGARCIRDTFSMTIGHPVEIQAILVCSNKSARGAHGIFKVRAGSGMRSVCVDGHNFNAYYSTLDEMVRRFEEAEGSDNPLISTTKTTLR